MNSRPYGRSAELKRWAIVATLLLCAALALSPVIDNQARNHYDSLFQRALVTFALARTLNGVISAVQGTELALQPAGVGVTLTPGELLDPVNDLVERISWIMLGATVSLGIQRVLIDVSAWWATGLLVAVLAAWLIFAYTKTPGGGSNQALLRVFLVALFIRFAVPLTLIVNDAVYQVFLEPKYLASTQVVSNAGEEINRIGNAGESEADDREMGSSGFGMLESINKALNQTKESFTLIEKVDRIKARAAQIIEHLIQLSVVFVMQTGILPLLFLWIFLKTAKWAFFGKSNISD